MKHNTTINYFFVLWSDFHWIRGGGRSELSELKKVGLKRKPSGEKYLVIASEIETFSNHHGEQYFWTNFWLFFEDSQNNSKFQSSQNIAV